MISRTTKKNITKILDSEEISHIDNKNKKENITNNNNGYFYEGQIKGTNLKTINYELREKIIELKKEIKKINNNNETLTKTITELKSIIQQKENTIINKEKEIKHLNDTINQKDKMINADKNEIKNLNNIINEKENKIEELNEKINEKENKINDLKEKINDKEAKIGDLNERINDKETKIGDLNGKLNANIQNINQNNSDILKLMEELKIKENEIKEYQKKYPFELLPNEQLLTVIFRTGDSKINYSVICKNTQLFSKVEELFYEKFPEYKENENYFLANGQKINRFKTIEENKIRFSENIILNQIDYDSEQ